VVESRLKAIYLPKTRSVDNSGRKKRKTVITITIVIVIAVCNTPVAHGVFVQRFEGGRGLFEDNLPAEN